MDFPIPSANIGINTGPTNVNVKRIDNTKNPNPTFNPLYFICQFLSVKEFVQSDAQRSGIATGRGFVARLPGTMPN